MGQKNMPKSTRCSSPLGIFEETTQRLPRHLEEHVAPLDRNAAGITQSLMPAQNQAGSEREGPDEPPRGPEVHREWRREITVDWQRGSHVELQDGVCPMRPR